MRLLCAFNMLAMMAVALLASRAETVGWLVWPILLAVAAQQYVFYAGIAAPESKALLRWNALAGVGLLLIGTVLVQ